MTDSSQPNISRRLRYILDIAKQQHGYISRKQSQNGNIPMKEQGGISYAKYHSLSDYSSPCKKPNVTTSFITWLHDCDVEFHECGDIKACLKSVPSIHGRFISEYNSKGEIILRTTVSSQGILLVKSPDALEALLLHISIDSNFRR